MKYIEKIDWDNKKSEKNKSKLIGVFARINYSFNDRYLASVSIPVDEELDLKKVAKASKDKKVEMIHMKELLPLTGYMRGGCSPIGMKKKFPTYIEETAQIFDKISISAGQRGVQVILNPEELAKYVDAQFVALI